MRDKIIEMLGQGYSQTVVAQCFGLTDGYISQIVSEEGVAEQVAALRAARLQNIQNHDDAIDDLENLALQKMKQLLPYMTKPSEVVRVFEAANSAKRKAELAGPSSASGPSQTIVNITLPAVAMQQFKIAPQERQVVEVEGRSLTTMPARNLVKQLERRKEERNTAPVLSDASQASKLLEQVSQGLPENSIANLL